MGYHLTSPAKCSFELHLSGRNLWSQTESYTIGETPTDSDPLFELTHRKAESYMLSRLMFDTPKIRAANGPYSVLNPYTVLIAKERGDYNRFVPRGLFDEGDEEASGETDKGNALEELKNLLDALYPYTNFYLRFHNEIMEFPEATHEMFQKSICNEVLMYYCKTNTNEYTLSKLIMAVNARYMGWETAALPKMIRKYTGKQYAAIVPRGFGKTKCIRNIAATLLVTFPGIEVLTLAHRKSLTSSTKEDIMTTLSSRFPPDKFGHYETMGHSGSIMLCRKDGSARSYLKYASSLLSDSLRGYDCHVVLQDEFLCLPSSSYTAVNAMSQRHHCKVGYLSSPITDRKDRLLNLVRGQEKCGGVNIYRLCLFCLDPEHVQYSTTRTGCYRSIYTPNHIVYSSDNKGFESVLTQSDASFENEQGVIRPSDLTVGDGYDGLYANPKTQFSRRFVRRLQDPQAYVQLSSVDAHGPNDTVYWIYIDPAFHPTKQSAMAICCV
ncbi:tripartite terminase subunit 3 [Elysia marginata]|uniref:Tripartite terminase subunit 3 n=1 Tax=Elysia marginata TaxID=1093978 RepID=A0AAV4HQ33_9GAST|nr:tripartite terminase subunit 3 [Elysia marginata]